MAFAGASLAQREELKRQLGITYTAVYQCITQFQDAAFRGPEIDTYITALEAAIAAVKTAAPLAMTLPPTATAATGSRLELTAAVTGGTAPYTYAWVKGAEAIPSATTNVLLVSGSVAATHAGVYRCTATDSTGATVFKDCTVTIS